MYEIMFDWVHGHMIVWHRNMAAILRLPFWYHIIFSESQHFFDREIVDKMYWHPIFYLTHWPVGDPNKILDNQFQN